MGYEIRNGRSYYYRKIRKGKKVVSKYVGSGESARLTAELTKIRISINQLDQHSKFKEHTLCQIDEKELNLLEQALNEVFTSVALANGYHQHKGQWRKKRLKKKN